MEGRKERDGGMEGQRKVAILREERGKHEREGMRERKGWEKRMEGERKET